MSSSTAIKPLIPAPAIKSAGAARPFFALDALHFQRQTHANRAPNGHGGGQPGDGQRRHEAVPASGLRWYLAYTAKIKMDLNAMARYPLAGRAGRLDIVVGCAALTQGPNAGVLNYHSVMLGSRTQGYAETKSRKRPTPSLTATKLPELAIELSAMWNT